MVLWWILVRDTHGARKYLRRTHIAISTNGRCFRRICIFGNQRTRGFTSDRYRASGDFRRWETKTPFTPKKKLSSGDLAFPQYDFTFLFAAARLYGACAYTSPLEPPLYKPSFSLFDEHRSKRDHRRQRSLDTKL